MDYYYFKELELRENPTRFGLSLDYKQHFILAKSRRKGFSFKNAGGATWKYTFFKDVKVAIIAETGSDALKTFEKCLNNIDFLTEYTEFGGPQVKELLKLVLKINKVMRKGESLLSLLYL